MQVRLNMSLSAPTGQNPKGALFESLDLAVIMETLSTLKRKVFSGTSLIPYFESAEFHDEYVMKLSQAWLAIKILESGSGVAEANKGFS